MDDAIAAADVPYADEDFLFDEDEEPQWVHHDTAVRRRYCPLRCPLQLVQLKAQVCRNHRIRNHRQPKMLPRTILRHPMPSNLRIELPNEDVSAGDHAANISAAMDAMMSSFRRRSQLSSPDASDALPLALVSAIVPDVLLFAPLAVPPPPSLPSPDPPHSPYASCRRSPGGRLVHERLPED